MWQFVLATCCMAMLVGCSPSEVPEAVMSEGMTIDVTCVSGSMKIEAGKKYVRTYSWNGKIKTFSLYPRSKRWDGSKGLHRPSGDREMHVVLEEGQQHFSSQEEIYPWLCWQNYGCRRDLWYTSDGLVVAWEEQQHPVIKKYSALSVEVWQLYVNGNKPQGLKGASDWIIRVGQPDFFKIHIGNPPLNMATNISGRKYYGKALDFMTESRISPELVEKVISSASPKPFGMYMCYSDNAVEGGDFGFFVLLNNDGDVVFVYGPHP
jgi:hypothetical protein